jgi:hypothetical protein
VDQSLAEYYAQRVEATARETGASERSIREWFDRHLITEQGLRGNVLMAPEHSGGLDNGAIQQLIDAHLVRAEKRGGATWFELAHDRLIAPVRKDNASWSKANLNQLQKQSSVWDLQGRSESLLLRGKELAAAEHWTAAHQDELLPAEVEFLNASRTLSQREKRAKLLTRLIAILGVAAILLAILAYRASLNAQRQERQAFAGELAAQSQAASLEFPVRSLLLAIEANSVTQAGEQRPASAEEALRAALRDPHGSPLPGHSGPVNTVAFSPDGQWLASGSDDHTARLFKVNPDGVLGDPTILTGHEDAITSLAFSPDNRWLATGSDDDTALQWGIGRCKPSVAVCAAIPGSIYKLALSPDGRWLATGSQDETVRLWDLQSADPTFKSIHLSNG